MRRLSLGGYREPRLTCPTCSKRGVMLHQRTSEDHYGCRYCGWFTFTDGMDETDVRERQALAEANPEWERADRYLRDAGVLFVPVEPIPGGNTDVWRCTGDCCGALVREGGQESHTAAFHEDETW